jgi:hypothetical protein
LDASVLLIFFNKCSDLRECLRNAERESDGLSVEVLVIDNGWLDGSPEMVKTELPTVPEPQQLEPLIRGGEQLLVWSRLWGVILSS